MQEIYVRSHYGWTITAYKYIVGYNELSLTCNIHYTYEGHAYSKLVLQVFGEIISKYSWRFNWQKNYGVKNETPLRIYAKEKSLNFEILKKHAKIWKWTCESTAIAKNKSILHHLFVITCCFVPYYAYVFVYVKSIAYNTYKFYWNSLRIGILSEPR